MFWCEPIEPFEHIARGVSQPIEQIARGVSQPIERIARGVSQPIEQIARGVSQPIEQIARGVSQPIEQLARVVSNHIEKEKLLQVERDKLGDLQQRCGCCYPGCEYRSSDRKNWMAVLDPGKLIINKIVWPGTHNSATNGIGIPLITRPFAECQTLSIYEQLVKGVRLLDVRVQEDRQICHGPLKSYSVGVVLEDVKRYLAETVSEIIILEIRTEFGHNDPHEFDKYLEEMLGGYLIPQDDNVFGNSVAEVLPKRVICIWKPRNSGVQQTSSLLWSGGYLRDDWVDTDLPLTKFQSNLDHLGEQPTVSARNFFYRVENTLTPQADNPGLYLTALTGWINGYARLFIAQCLSKGIADRFQSFRCLADETAFLLLYVKGIMTSWNVSWCGQILILW
ncbi:uncharacterized protein LOC141599522 isoform X2 [Silene latifolia]|uniref:uncharacterized protein LOC141599522 isoform X2 n=1 Tax=Silene latifolia TaxID=37657 RepID=UPI003D771437